MRSVKTLILGSSIEKINMTKNKSDLLCKVYLFDTKYPLHRPVADIDVLNLNHLANETIFYDVKPFPVAKFPMDQGCK